jgi:two-component system OmpR family response regulator
LRRGVASRKVDKAIQNGANNFMHVLIVDDEPQIRSMVRLLLSRNGIQTVEAHDGRSALNAIRSHASKIAALLTDIEMSGLSGIELANSVHLDSPAMPVLFFSGSGIADDELNRGFPGTRLLRKPFAPQDLVAAVRTMLVD